MFNIPDLATVKSREKWFQENKQELFDYIYSVKNDPRQTLRVLARVQEEYGAESQFIQAVDYAKEVKTYDNAVLKQLKKIQEEHLLCMNSINDLCSCETGEIWTCKSDQTSVIDGSLCEIMMVVFKRHPEFERSHHDLCWNIVAVIIIMILFYDLILPRVCNIV